MTSLIRKLGVEFIGTFFLFFTIGATTINQNPGVIPPLAIGAVLMVAIYAGGYISGAHYNPAVSMAVAVRGRLNWGEFLPYVVTQLLAASIAAEAALFLKGTPPVTGPSPDPVTIGQVVLAEFLFTFLLAFVVVNVATAKKTEGNSFYGLAIGFTVLAGAFAVGPISGGSFNPAVTTGAVIVGAIPLSKYVVYVATELVAGALAGFAFKALNPEDK